MLTERDKRCLQQVSLKHFPAIVVGLVICVTSAAYTVWGIQQMTPQQAPHPETAFDRPIARLALLMRPHQERLARMQPKIKLEQTLLNDLAQQYDMTMRLLLTLIRVILGSCGITFGLILLSVGLTQRQFLRVMKKL